MMKRKCDTCKWRGLLAVHCINIEVMAMIESVLKDDETGAMWVEFQAHGCANWKPRKSGTCGECEWGQEYSTGSGPHEKQYVSCNQNAITANQPEIDSYVYKISTTPGCGDWQPKQGDGDDL